ncbi:subtilisin-like protein, partial [Acephala macrosclerotiorum]
SWGVVLPSCDTFRHLGGHWLENPTGPWQFLSHWREIQYARNRAVMRPVTPFVHCPLQCDAGLKDGPFGTALLFEVTPRLSTLISRIFELSPTPMSAFHSPGGEARHIRILSLDTGGVKCLSSLIILEELMKGVSKSEPIDKPCKHFDLICGTQWGGILAIMLGRLQMSIEECIAWLSQLSWNGEYLLWRIQRNKNSSYFEKLFKKLVEKSCNGKQDTPFYDPEDNTDSACKTSVLAFDVHGRATPTIFRSYFTSAGERRCDIPIWKIAMAVISDPDNMSPDFSLMRPLQAIYSNPSREALNEGKRISNGHPIKAVINIGTGDRRQTRTPNKFHSWIPTKVHLELIRLLEEVSTDPHRVAHELERDGIEGRFYGRYSVESGLHTVHSMDFSKTARRTIISETETYLTEDVVGRIKGWSAELTGSSSSTRMEALTQRQIASGSSALFGTNTGKMLRTDRLDNSEIATRDWFNQFDISVRPLFAKECKDDDFCKIKVAILDTGIDSTHPFMSVGTGDQRRFKYSKYKDFTKADTAECETPVDTSGHGTHIAGIILKVCPYVDLYIARVFESRVLGVKEAMNVATVGGFLSSRRSAFSNMKQAIQYATDVWDVNIISMSFGFDVEMGALPDVEKAIEAAYDSNIVMLAGVSNDGNRPLNPIAFPALHPCVICINSADGHGNKSDFNPEAPNGRGKTRREDNFSILGENIESCWPAAIKAEGVVRQTESKGTLRTCSGSSFATAIAASTAALIMELGRKRRYLIAKEGKLRTYRGIQQVFTRMAGENEIRGFKNIRPWFVLSGSEEDAAHIIDKEVKNP